MGGQLGRPSGARFRTYERLKRYAEEIKGTLFDTRQLRRAVEDVYNYPLRQVAIDTLNRQLRSGISDEDLASRVIELREEGRLCDHPRRGRIPGTANHLLARACRTMTLNIAKVRQYLDDFDFETLFIEELGWDRYAADLELPIDGQRLHLRGFAEKRGVQVFECRAGTAAEMPDFKTQRKIETQFAELPANTW